MLAVKVYGGLAGQMLQYAVGKSVAAKNNVELFLDLSWYKQNVNLEHPREFRLDKLKTNFKTTDLTSPLWRMRLTERKLFRPFKHQLVVEKDFSQFDPAVLNTPKDAVLDGYWNSYKYFEDIKDELSEHFVPKDSPDKSNNHYFNEIAGCNSISVHFRRGDYANTSFHGIMTHAYYETAIRMACENLSDPRLYIFSDDLAWVTNNFDFKVPYTVMDFNLNEKNLWDMRLMSACKINIIANSGFSWWGAYLNENYGKIVFAPKIWIAEQSRPMTDFIPDTWIRI
jgi:hypothetical protein